MQQAQLKKYIWGDFGEQVKTTLLTSFLFILLF